MWGRAGRGGRLCLLLLLLLRLPLRRLTLLLLLLLLLLLVLPRCAMRLPGGCLGVPLYLAKKAISAVFEPPFAAWPAEPVGVTATIAATTASTAAATTAAATAAGAATAAATAATAAGATARARATAAAAAAHPGTTAAAASSTPGTSAALGTTTARSAVPPSSISLSSIPPSTAFFATHARPVMGLEPALCGRELVRQNAETQPRSFAHASSTLPLRPVATVPRGLRTARRRGMASSTPTAHRCTATDRRRATGRRRSLSRDYDGGGF